LINVAEFIGKGYLMVLKMSFSKRFEISKLLTDAQSLDTVIHQQFPKVITFLAKKMQMDFEWNEYCAKTR